MEYIVLLKLVCNIIDLLFKSANYSETMLQIYVLLLSVTDA